MRKSFLIIVALMFAASACSVSKEARKQQHMLSGTWSLDNIRYENNTGNFSSVIFNDAKDICFEGTNWFFRNNNSTARYTINQSTLCTGGDRFIRWSIVDGSPNQLQFKFIDEKLKDISGGKGYRLNIASVGDAAMVLKSNVTVDGEIVTVVYEFTKKI